MTAAGHSPASRRPPGYCIRDCACRTSITPGGTVRLFYTPASGQKWASTFAAFAFRLPLTCILQIPRQDLHFANAPFLNSGTGPHKKNRPEGRCLANIDCNPAFFVPYPNASRYRLRAAGSVSAVLPLITSPPEGQRANPEQRGCRRQRYADVAGCAGQITGDPIEFEGVISGPVRGSQPRTQTSESRVVGQHWELSDNAVLTATLVPRLLTSLYFLPLQPLLSRPLRVELPSAGVPAPV